MSQKNRQNNSEVHNFRIFSSYPPQSPVVIGLGSLGMDFKRPSLFWLEIHGLIQDEPEE
jgi:hypothetical protein